MCNFWQEFDPSLLFNALYVFLQEVERQSQADLEALQEGFMRSVPCR